MMLKICARSLKNGAYSLEAPNTAQDVPEAHGGFAMCFKTGLFLQKFPLLLPGHLA